MKESFSMDRNSALRLLGLENSYTTEELKSAYRSLAKKLHPDINRTDGAEESFKRLGEANDLLNLLLPQPPSPKAYEPPKPPPRPPEPPKPPETKPYIPTKPVLFRFLLKGATIRADLPEESYLEDGCELVILVDNIHEYRVKVPPGTSRDTTVTLTNQNSRMIGKIILNVHGIVRH